MGLALSPSLLKLRKPLPCRRLVPDLVMVVMSPAWVNSALLLIELTRISSMPSTDGKTLRPPSPMPLRRTLVVEMPSTEISFW